MSDLLSDSQVALFKGAIRDVTDTFHKYPVEFDLLNGGPLTPLRCGRKSIAAELVAKETGQEISEAYQLSFNREYLTEEGLFDFKGKLRITYDTPVVMDGKQFAIVKLKEDATMRNENLMVFIEVAR